MTAIPRLLDRFGCDAENVIQCGGRSESVWDQSWGGARHTPTLCLEAVRGVGPIGETMRVLLRYAFAPLRGVALFGLSLIGFAQAAVAMVVSFTGLVRQFELE